MPAAAVKPGQILQAGGYAPNKIVLPCGGHAIYQIEDPRFESPERPDKLGIPAHFSLELPRRCMTLINELLPATANVFAGPKDRAMGGLTSTFLLSMAGPMLTLPIERIERQLQKKEREGYADDRLLNPTLSDALKNELGGGRFRRAPFFAPGQWSFADFEERTQQPECFHVPGPSKFPVLHCSSQV